jgi:hypothetical protein
VRKNTFFLLFFIVLKVSMHLWLIHPAYDLHRDEYLHLDQARHLAWGYDSVPPFTSWISWIIMQLGNGVFWVKFFPALFGALTMVVVWKTIETLKGNLFALVLGAAAVIFSAMARLNILFQPNSLDILFWTLFYYTIVQYISSENKKWLMKAAVVFAFGFLNKYNIVFLVLGMLPALLLTPYRKIFLFKQLYWSILVALLIVSPNIIWQIRNHFPVVHHMQTLAATQLVNVNRLDFLKEQILFFAGALFVLLAAFISFFTYPPFYKYRLFFGSFVFTLMLFTYFKAKGYYAVGLYPILLAFGAVYLEKLFQGGWRYYLRPVAIAIPVLSFIPLLKIAFPLQPPAVVEQNAPRYKALNLLRWEDGKDHPLPQDFADMLGWKELAAKVDRAFEQIADSSHTLVLCDNYGEAGAINYYSAYKNISAVTREGDYYKWFLDDPKLLNNIVLVKDVGNPDTALTKERQLFKTVLPAGAIENGFAREQGTRIFVLKEYRDPVPLREKIIALQNNR